MGTSRTRDFDISKYENVDVRSFTLRIVTGQDSLDATARSIGKGDRPNPMLTFSARSNTIADAIVAVNGVQVVTPYVQWEDWSLRTQAFVERAYDRMNGVTNAEMDDFLGRHGLMPKPTPEPIEPPASSSGTSSPGT